MRSVDWLEAEGVRKQREWEARWLASLGTCVCGSRPLVTQEETSPLVTMRIRVFRAECPRKCRAATVHVYGWRTGGDAAMDADALATAWREETSAHRMD